MTTKGGVHTLVTQLHFTEVADILAALLLRSSKLGSPNEEAREDVSTSVNCTALRGVNAPFVGHHAVAPFNVRPSRGDPIRLSHPTTPGRVAHRDTRGPTATTLVSYIDIMGAPYIDIYLKTIDFEANAGRACRFGNMIMITFSVCDRRRHETFLANSAVTRSLHRRRRRPGGARRLGVLASAAYAAIPDPSERFTPVRSAHGQVRIIDRRPSGVAPMRTADLLESARPSGRRRRWTAGSVGPIGATGRRDWSERWPRGTARTRWPVGTAGSTRRGGPRRPCSQDDTRAIVLRARWASRVPPAPLADGSQRRSERLGRTIPTGYAILGQSDVAP